MLVDVQNTINGMPYATGGTSLALSAVPLSRLPSVGPGGPGPAFVSVDFSQSGLFVNQGDVLAIIVQQDRGGTDSRFGMSWTGERTGRDLDYSGGRAWNSFGELGWFPTQAGRLSDYGFRTYVTPIPEPTAAMLAVAIAPLLLRRRRMSACD